MKSIHAFYTYNSRTLSWLSKVQHVKSILPDPFLVNIYHISRDKAKRRKGFARTVESIDAWKLLILLGEIFGLIANENSRARLGDSYRLCDRSGFIIEVVDTTEMKYHVKNAIFVRKALGDTLKQFRL